MPERPRITPAVRREAGVTVLIWPLLAWVAWNVAVAPQTDLPGLHLFAAYGLALIAHWTLNLAGYALGEGLSRRSLVANEQYAELAAGYLVAVEEAAEREEDERAAQARGGQG